MKRPETVGLVEYGRTESVYGHRSRLQASTSILSFDMADQRSALWLRTADEALEAYECALEADNEIQLDASERMIRDILNSLTPEEGEDSGGVMAGAAWFVGAAFCPGVGKVQGMAYFAEHAFYSRIARDAALRGGALQRLGEEGSDPATRAAAEWLSTRTELPEVLRRWHKRARRLAGADGSRSSSRSSAIDQKIKRKSAAASRRKNRQR